MTTLFAPQAEAELHEYLDYLVERDPGAAMKLSDRIFDTIQRIAAGELHGPKQP